MDPTAPQHLCLSIDYFFRSLARDQEANGLSPNKEAPDAALACKLVLDLIEIALRRTLTQ
jgi:hypothetical protein